MSEFQSSHEQRAREVAERYRGLASEMAACYARVFAGTPDGKRVLADLQVKFSHDRPRFSGDRPNAITGAVIDGQCAVLKEIESAVKLGTHTIKPTP